MYSACLVIELRVDINGLALFNVRTPKSADSKFKTTTSFNNFMLDRSGYNSKKELLCPDPKYSAHKML